MPPTFAGWPRALRLHEGASVSVRPFVSGPLQKGFLALRDVVEIPVWQDFKHILSNEQAGLAIGLSLLRRRFRTQLGIELWREYQEIAETMNLIGVRR